MCHDPSISDDTVKDEAAPWYCADCTRRKGTKVPQQPPPVPTVASYAQAQTLPIAQPIHADYETVRGESWQGKSAEEVASFHPDLIVEQV